MPNAEIASTSASVTSTGPHHRGKMSVFLARPAPRGKIQENTKRIAAVKAKVRRQESSVTDMIHLQSAVPTIRECFYFFAREHASLGRQRHHRFSGWHLTGMMQSHALVVEKLYTERLTTYLRFVSFFRSR